MPTSSSPKAAVRHIREHENAIDDLTRQLLDRRALMIEDLQEAEAAVKALKSGIERIDGLVHLAPRQGAPS